MAEEFRHRLDTNVEKFVENYIRLVRSAKVQDKTSVAREEFNTSVYTTALVQAAESLLKTVSELKLAVILQDFETMNSHIDARNKLLGEKVKAIDSELDYISADVSEALTELQTHYYRSRWR